MESKQEGIDTDLYSRQIGTFGMETMGKLMQMKVLIVGMRGIGVETAKNLILAGPHRVDIWDPTVIEVRDLGANFYLNEDMVGKMTRAQGSVEKLKELNNYVHVDVVNDNLGMDLFGRYNLVVFSEVFTSIEDQIAWNKECRAKGIGTIISQAHGLYGYVFVDFGDHFNVHDEDGERTRNFIVSDIVKMREEDPTKNHLVVFCHEDKRHTFHDNSWVKFTELQGSEELNMPEMDSDEGLSEDQLKERQKVIEDHQYKITVIDGYSFRIYCDIDKVSDYVGAGIVEDVKVPQHHPFISLEQAIQKPLETAKDKMWMISDFAFFDRPGVLHFAFQGLQAFKTKHQRWPGKENVDEVFAIIHEINENLKKTEGAFTLEEINEDIKKVIGRACRYGDACISPVAAYFGGIVAQEVVKFTGKYTPISQFYHCDFFTSLPKEEVKSEAENSRYDDQISIFGNEIQRKLENLNIFMVGAGALGCEFIKAYAMMGIGCGPTGKVTCTDNDNIEVSNLNRQFLFRKGNVGHSKSGTACDIGKQMNPRFNVHSMQEFVSPDTEHIFNDEFWESLSFVVNAVDNIKARQYVDQRCVWFKKALLESGTLGTKANTQQVVPHITECYSDSQDPPEDSVPMCTLRNFPNQIEHCIEWGRAAFNTNFVEKASEAIDYLDKPQIYLTQLKSKNTTAGQIEELTKVRDIANLKKKGSFQDCVELARLEFENSFTNTIKQLLKTFPKDYKDKEGNPFWSGPKRCPHPLAFDADNQTHMLYVISAANLFAANVGIAENRNWDEVKEMAKSVMVPEFEAKDGIKIQVEEGKEEQKKDEPASEDDFAILEQLKKDIDPSTIGVNSKNFHPADFEKDDDKNFHIDFIHAAAQLRAENYDIKTCDRQNTKMIAGKIIPAIATTTAMITGAVMAELYKYVQGFNTIEDYRNAFINLAVSLFVFTEPSPPKKHRDEEFNVIMGGPIKALPADWTIWDSIDVKQGSLTIQEFFDYMKAEWKVDTTMLSVGNLALYNHYLP